MSDRGDALERLVAGLDPTVASSDWVVAACGVPAIELADLGGLLGATSEPAVAFLEALPTIVRNLSSTTTLDKERCVGQVRGPISWSETVTAWSAGIGTDDVFVCVSPRRDYDLAENRLVKWLLHRLAIAPRLLDTASSMRIGEAARSAIRARAAGAEAWRRHRYLARVSADRPTHAELRKVRTSRHVANYAPALRLAERLRDPFRPESVAALLDPSTAADLEVLTWLDEALADRARRPTWTVAGSSLQAGPLSYRHASHFGPADRGIRIGPVVLGSVPRPADGSAPTLDDLSRATATLAARAAARPWYLVADRGDAHLAVQMALDLGGRQPLGRP